MQKTRKFIKKMALSALFLSTIISFSNCSSEDLISPNLNEGISLNGEKDLSATTTSRSVVKGTINTQKLRSDGGFAYKISESIVNGDEANNPNQSTLKLYENGVELPQAHAVHDDIRKLGKGRFSHWGSTILFSTSDNTNPKTNGRVYTYAIENAATAPLNPTAPVPPTNTDVNTSIMGYAMVNGKTTGGQGGQEVTVTTLAQLKAALGDNTPRIIYVSGTIKGAGQDPIYVKSNKSIIGKSGAVLHGLQFFVFGVNNLIFQNLTFRNYVVYAAIQIKEKSHHIWIDHCDFGNDRTHGWEHWGKDITITREADYVTVSWNKFHDTHLSVLISGGIIGHEADAGKLHVTMHHNFWYNVSEREPSMNYGRVHMFNNYHLNNSGYSIGIRAEGIVRTDNEFFENCGMPIRTQVAKDPAGYISGLNTNIYKNSGKNLITTPESNWVPEYEYKSFLHAAADVPAIVTKGAGPQ